MLRSRSARRLCRIIFGISLALLLLILLLEQAGLYLFLPEVAKNTLMLILECAVVISLVLGFRLSSYRWLRVTASVLLGIVLAASILLTFTTQRNIVTIVDDSGPETLVIQQNSWVLGTDNRLFVKEGPLFIRSLNRNLITNTSAQPFSTGDYKLEWAEDSVTVSYKEGRGEAAVWTTVEVPLK